uniref:PHD-type domain-containing protein n=1 Tax=Acrobeloides nanus TaxID=290746 RepID=A0A914DKY6_9BILA
MDENFSEQLAQETLKRTTGSILIDAGFHKAKPGALNILSDILKKYLEKLYKTTVNFAQHADHNSVLIEDALAALKKLNISPETIVDYMEKQKPKPLPNPNPPSITVDNEKENQEITILSDSDEPTDLEIQPSGSLQIPDEDQGKEDTKYWACPICSDVWEEGKNMVECDMCKYWHHWECVNYKEDPTSDSWICKKCTPKYQALRKFFAQFEDVEKH